MGARHAGREAALQMLFPLDGKGADLEDTVTLFWQSFEADPEGQGYANEAVRGVFSVRPALDVAIGKASQHWRLERMPCVDRNLLRLGVWELLHHPEIPAAVILNEAVELAKTYGHEESGAFVNGVLQQLARTLRPDGSVTSPPASTP